MGTASKSASVAEPRSRRSSRIARRAREVGLLVLLLCVPAIAHAEMAGRFSVGYARLFLEGAPGGSFSVAGGLDWPVAETIRAGGGVGFSLLGSSVENRGSLFANVDYSMFEFLGLVHWEPGWPGPVARITGGAGVMSARAEISSPGGGAGFSDLAREEIVPALALETTLMSKGPALVRVGLELGGRFGFLDGETWAVGSARVAFHY